MADDPSVDIPIEPIKSHLFLTAENMILKKQKEKIFRLTPLMVTLYEGVLTHIDIQNFIEMGLQIVRLRMNRVTRNDKLKLLQMLRNAQAWLCEKYDVSTWPIAICIDVPNAAIRSGYMDEAMKEQIVVLKKGSKITVTCEYLFWNKCNSMRVFIDDPHTIQTITPNAEITFCGGGTKFKCIEVINKKNILCEVIRGGILGNNEFVTVRGIKYKRPPLSKIDLELLAFAKELQFDIITVLSVRYGATINRLRNECGKDYEPLFVSTICDQEGLDNIDEILQASDGIILAREFLTHQLVNRNSLTTIQMQICAKCRLVGKPFFISGNILEQTLNDGSVSTCDLVDITNAVMQRAGFVLRHYNNAVNALKAMKILDSVCKSVERSKPEDDFLRIIDEFKVPTNAGDACVISCALMAKQSGSNVIIIPTVTGRTAVQLSQVAPLSVIITISRNPSVARKMQLFRGIYAIIYDSTVTFITYLPISCQVVLSFANPSTCNQFIFPEPKKGDWFEEMDARIQFAVSYGIKKDLLKYGHYYVTLHKSTYASSFCDSVSLWTVTTKENRSRIICSQSQPSSTRAPSAFDVSYVMD